MKTKQYKCGGKVRKYAEGTGGTGGDGNGKKDSAIGLGSIINIATTVGKGVGDALTTEDQYGVNKQGSVNSGIATMTDPTKLVTNSVNNFSKGIKDIGKGNFKEAAEDVARIIPFVGGFLGNEDAKREAAKQRRIADFYQTMGAANAGLQDKNNTNYQSTFAKGGIQTDKVNAEVEKEEVLKYPNGKIQAISKQAPSHAEGGVKMNLPTGTQILGKNKIPGTDIMFKELGQQLAKADKTINIMTNKQPTALTRKTAELNKQNIQNKFDSLMALQESQKQHNQSTKFAKGGIKSNPVGTGTVRKTGDWYDVHSDLRGQFLKQLSPEGVKAAVELEKLSSNDPNREKLSREFVAKHGDKYVNEAAVDSTAKVYGTTVKDLYAGNKYYNKRNVGMSGTKEQPKQDVVKFGIRQLSTDYARPESKKERVYSPVTIQNIREPYTRTGENQSHALYAASGDLATGKKPIVYKSSYNDMNKLVEDIKQKGDTTINNRHIIYNKGTDKLYSAVENTSTPVPENMVKTKTKNVKGEVSTIYPNYAENVEKYAKGGKISTDPLKFKSPNVEDATVEDQDFTKYANTLYGDKNVYADKNKNLLAFDNESTFNDININKNKTSNNNIHNNMTNFAKKQNLGEGLTNIASLLPVGYNIAKGLGKYNKLNEQELYNPNDSKVNDLLNNRIYNIQPELENNRITQRIMDRNLRNSGLSQAGLMGGYFGNTSARRSADAKAFADKQNIENQYTAQKADMLNQQGRDKAAIKASVKQSNLQSKANRNNMLGTGLSQLSQFAQTKQLMKNQKNVDMSKVGLLKDMFPNYDFEMDKNGNLVSIKLKK